MWKLWLAAALVAAAFFISYPLERALSAEQPHFTEGSPQRVRAVICDDADKALSLLETWRKSGNSAANAELSAYKNRLNSRGDRICGKYYGAILPVKQLASVGGLSLPKNPDRKMTWYVIAVAYGHLFQERGFMVSRYRMKPKTSAEPI